MSRFASYPPILKYHRIGPTQADHVPTVSVTAFERQMRLIARFGLRVISFNEIGDRLSRGERVPPGHIAVTFDDGYDDTYTTAWPMLKRFGFPATVFITPGDIGKPGFLTWEQAAELAADGFGIGNHTMHHAYLPLVPEARLAEELLESKRVIEAKIRRPIHTLSYPVGGFTRRVIEIASDHYAAACTTNRAFERNGLDRFALRRVKITERDTNPLAFLVKVSGYYDAFRRLKQPG
ncbi:MAG: hypothetical protein COV75_03395 [Candidatus Omnitrophica bacterium CG11_big_fil_rev_8_21_14_0_20_63_9]|nr:MAG: hypothetical protein COV75_03395 [Candidatus Omnitrophica bacterium CG11_big_fil_rev_8_21_14_0_20_63_9]